MLSKWNDSEEFANDHVLCLGLSPFYVLHSNAFEKGICNTFVYLLTLIPKFFLWCRSQSSTAALISIFIQPLWCRGTASEAINLLCSEEGSIHNININTPEKSFIYTPILFLLKGMPICDKDIEFIMCNVWYSSRETLKSIPIPLSCLSKLHRITIYSQGRVATFKLLNICR